MKDLKNSKKRVMIIESDDSVRDVLGELLDSSGFDVFQAKTGQQAVRTLKSNPGPWFSIVSDFDTMGLNGGEFLHYLLTHHLRVEKLILTSVLELTRHGNPARCEVHVLSKPFAIQNIFYALGQSA